MTAFVGEKSGPPLKASNNGRLMRESCDYVRERAGDGRGGRRLKDYGIMGGGQVQKGPKENYKICEQPLLIH